jgi:hypothetical protein
MTLYLIESIEKIYYDIPNCTESLCETSVTISNHFRLFLLISNDFICFLIFRCCDLMLPCFTSLHMTYLLIQSIFAPFQSFPIVFYLHIYEYSHHSPYYHIVMSLVIHFINSKESLPRHSGHSDALSIFFFIYNFIY